MGGQGAFADTAQDGDGVLLNQLQELANQVELAASTITDLGAANDR